jgi:hypothetical protein
MKENKNIKKNKKVKSKGEEIITLLLSNCSLFCHVMFRLICIPRLL